LLAKLNARVFERGWLSSNGVLFYDAPGQYTLVDSGSAAHVSQTLALVDEAVGSGRLVRIVNTHLHSDHCGGNAALQARWHCDVYVPEWSEHDVEHWCPSGLSYAYTGQHCERFVARGVVKAGETVTLGGNPWRSIGAPGHDHKALMFFHPATRLLLAGDALWQERLAVVFPELARETGFAEVAATLDCIEALQAAWVVPGHGPPFSKIAVAVEASRRRLRHFMISPSAHAQYSARSLVMFHLLQHRTVAVHELADHIASTPVFQDIASLLETTSQALCEEIVNRLLADGLIYHEADLIRC
jgi:glyoxylase-like metal-dependent hydrolase (beta-lactamase superfamily II)